MSDSPSDNAFDEFFDDLDLPDTDCEQVHPVVERFVAGINLSQPDWLGTMSDWMEQANSCLTNEVLDALGEPPTDPDELGHYIWTVIRMGWLFYQKFSDGEPFNT